MSVTEIFHHAFTDELGESIWIDWIRQRAFSDPSAIWLAINCTARGKYDGLDTSAHHSIQQHPRAVHVDVVISAWRRHRLANIGESGKMHDRIDPMRRKRYPKSSDRAPLCSRNLPSRTMSENTASETMR